MKSSKENDITVPIEFDDLLTQLLDNHNLMLKANDNPSLPICPFRDPTKPYCKYKQTLSASKGCEDYCRFEFQTCPTYQEQRLSVWEKRFIQEAVGECLINGIDFDKAQRHLRESFVTMKLINKQRKGGYEQLKRTGSTNPLPSVRQGLVEGRDSSGLIGSNPRHSS